MDFYFLLFSYLSFDKNNLSVNPQTQTPTTSLKNEIWQPKFAYNKTMT